MDDRRSELKKIIMDTRTLPTLPGVVLKLNELSESRRASVQEMARIVTSDQALSARILRLANSPSYGFHRVSTISNAMILLGVNVVKSLALSSSIFEIMENESVGLWEHSLGVGAAANLIAGKLGLPECEEIATAALLHDIGKVVISIKCADIGNGVRSAMREKQLFPREAELELLETDHAEVGGWLAKCWFLPDKLSEPIAFHHDISQAVNHRLKTAVVHLADVLIRASGFGDGDDGSLVPQIQPEAWELLGLTDQQLAELVEELEDKLIEVRHFSQELQA